MLDGKVLRHKNGKELRYPVILTLAEKEYSGLYTSVHVRAQQHHHAAERRAVGLEVEKDPRVGAPPRP